MKFEPKEIDFERAENIKTILRRENKSQVSFAKEIDVTPETINRIINLKQPLSEKTAQLIVFSFPEYRKEWILGYDRYMTEEEKIRAKDGGRRLNAPIMVLDTALLNVCHSEGIEAPEISEDLIPEIVLLTSQLEDYAEMLMRNYLHRNRSHFWNTVDSFAENIENNRVNSDV